MVIKKYDDISCMSAANLSNNKPSHVHFHPNMVADPTVSNN